VAVFVRTRAKSATAGKAGGLVKRSQPRSHERSHDVLRLVMLRFGGACDVHGSVIGQLG